MRADRPSSNCVAPRSWRSFGQMRARKRQMPLRGPHRVALQRQPDRKLGRFDQDAIRTNLRVMVEHLLHTAAQVPAIALGRARHQHRHRTQPVQAIPRRNLAPWQQRFHGLVIALQQRQRARFLQAPRLAAIGPLDAFARGVAFALFHQRQRFLRTPKRKQDRDAHVRHAVVDFAAMRQDGLRLLLQILQRRLTTPVIEQCIGFFAAQALVTRPARVDAAQGFVAHLDAFFHPARAIDVGITRGQILGHADRLRALHCVGAMRTLEQRHRIAQRTLAFAQVADPVTHFPMPDEHLQPRVGQRLAQRTRLRQQGLGTVDLQIADVVGQPRQQLRILRLPGFAQIVLQLFYPVPDFHRVAPAMRRVSAPTIGSRSRRNRRRPC